MGLKPKFRLSGKALLIGRIVAAAVVVLFMVYYFHYFYHKHMLQYDLTEYEVVSETDVISGIIPDALFSNDTLIQQELPPIGDEIDAIRIFCISEIKSRNGNVIFQIQNAKSGQVYLEYTKPSKKVGRNAYITVPLQELTSEQRAEQLMLTITAECEGSAGVTVYVTKTDGIAGCKLLCDSEERKGDLVLKYVKKTIPDWLKTLGILAFFAAFCMVFSIAYKKQNPGRIGMAVCFVVLYVLYLLRAPGDSFSSYLWAEDGRDLISGAILYGPRSAIITSNETYWMMQKLIGVVCYWCCLPFRNLTYLALLQGLVTKLIAVAGIGWFMSDRFAWVLKERFQRFLVCAGIIFLMPTAIDVFTCDTSFPFILNFTVFLIGLDLLVKDKVSAPTWLEIAFLALQALSTAAAPFVGAVAGCAYLRWIADGYKHKTLKICPVLIETGKVGIVGAAVMIQLMTILSSDRVSESLQLWYRIKTCVKRFPFFPYFQSSKLWLVLIFCLVCWIALLLLSAIPLKMAAYSFLYSYFFLLFCSMAVEISEMEDNFQFMLTKNDTNRYILLSSMIMIFLLLVALFKIQGIHLRIPVAVAVLCAVTAVTAQFYHLELLGSEYTPGYDQNISSCDINGTDVLRIPVPPAMEWILTVPAEITAKIGAEEAEGEVFSIENSLAEETVILDPASPVIHIRGYLVDQEGNPFDQVFLKTGENIYIAAIMYTGDNILRRNTDETPAKGSEYLIGAPPSLFLEGNTYLEFIGKKADGTCCRKMIKVTTSIESQSESN